MSGWTWASVDDINALFNYYVGVDVFRGPFSCPLLADTVEKLDNFLTKRSMMKTDLSESPVLNDRLQGNAFRYPEFH